MITGDPLQIQLLGGFSLRQGRRQIRPSSRKGAALLAVLAARPGETVTRERLCGLLWSRSAPEQARASLREALTRLRRDLNGIGHPVIETDGDGLWLRPDAADVDLLTLESALASGDPSAPDRALDLYHGELLEGIALNEAPFEEWRQVEAERLRRRTLQVLGERLAERVEARDVETAIRLGERLLELDPAAEETYQALMRLDLDRGALGSAMRRYRRCREALAAGLGVSPSAATEALRRRIRAGPARSAETEPGAPPVVAVLPFNNRCGDAVPTHLALGFAEEVIRALSRFRSLHVIAAQSSFAGAEAEPAARAVNLREVAEELGARYLLSGSVALGDGKLRIGAELLEAASGRCLWSERYDAAAAEIFSAQDEIAGAVAAALAVQIDSDLLRAAGRKPLESLEVYDCWLRGVACLRRGTPESLIEARPLFERALAADPGFARAYAGLSLTHFNEWSCVAWERWEENERCAYGYAERAARMDDGDHVTHFVLGRILLYRRDFERAERHLLRAETLNPNDADMLAQLSLSDACLGAPERGVGRVPLAMRLNPFHDDWYFAFAASSYLLARRPADAIDFALRAPHAATDMHACLACAYAHLGELAEAHRHRDAFLTLFRQRISFGRAPEPDEPVRWLMHVNPIRRPEEQEYLITGLARAGLTVPPGR